MTQKQVQKEMGERKELSPAVKRARKVRTKMRQRLKKEGEITNLNPLTREEKKEILDEHCKEKFGKTYREIKEENLEG